MKTRLLSEEARPFVHFSFESERKYRHRPMGQASILGHLKASGITSEGYYYEAGDDDKTIENALEDAAQFISRYPQAVLGVGVYCWNAPLVERFLFRLREAGVDATLVLGGPEITGSPVDASDRFEAADLFVQGYGEEALRRLLAGRSPVDIEGVWRRGETPGAACARIDPEQLRSPHLEGVIEHKPGQRVEWETSRGCMYACKFCQHSGGIKGISRFNPERLDLEVQAFVRAGVGEISILNPVFNAGPRAIQELRLLADYGFRGRITAQAKLELVSPALIDACAGLDITLEFGIQSTIPSDLADVGRRWDCDKAADKLKKVQDAGIKYEVSVIYGLPRQTPESFRQTLNWCTSHGVQTIRAYPLSLLKGTALEREREIWGFQTSDGPVPHIVATSSADVLEMGRMRRLAVEAMSN